jgi:hypothetical protein
LEESQWVQKEDKGEGVYEEEPDDIDGKNRQALVGARDEPFIIG